MNGKQKKNTVERRGDNDDGRHDGLRRTMTEQAEHTKHGDEYTRCIHGLNVN